MARITGQYLRENFVDKGRDPGDMGRFLSDPSFSWDGDALLMMMGAQDLNTSGLAWRMAYNHLHGLPRQDRYERGWGEVDITPEEYAWAEDRAANLGLPGQPVEEPDDAPNPQTGYHAMSAYAGGLLHSGVPLPEPVLKNAIQRARENGSTTSTAGLASRIADGQLTPAQRHEVVAGVGWSQLLGQRGAWPDMRYRGRESLPNLSEDEAKEAWQALTEASRRPKTGDELKDGEPLFGIRNLIETWREKAPREAYESLLTGQHPVLERGPGEQDLRFLAIRNTPYPEHHQFLLDEERKFQDAYTREHGARAGRHGRRDIEQLLMHNQHIRPEFINDLADVVPEIIPSRASGWVDRVPGLRERLHKHALASGNSEMAHDLIRNEVSTPQQVEELVNRYPALRSKLAETGMEWSNPDLFAEHKVAVAFGTNKLRQARDHILTQGKTELSPKDMPPGNWGIGRLPNGNISAALLQQAIDNAPRIPYNVTHGQWDGAQRHSKEESNVFQLNITSDQVAKLKEAGVYDRFRQMHKASRYSGHPLGPTGIGWVRWTGGKKTGGIFMDEVQSDFGQSFIRQAAAQARDQGYDEGEAARRAEEQYGSENEFDTIKNIVFGGKHPSEVLQEAFHEWLRTPHLETEQEMHDNGLPPCKKCGSTTGSHSYSEAGPVCAEKVAMPGPGASEEELKEYGRTYGQRYGRCHEPFERRVVDYVGLPIHIWQPESKATISLGRSEDKLPGHFYVGYRDVPQKKMGFKPGEYGELKTQTGRHRSEVRHEYHKSCPNCQKVVRVDDQVTRRVQGVDHFQCPECGTLVPSHDANRVDIQEPGKPTWKEEVRKSEDEDLFKSEDQRDLRPNKTFAEHALPGSLNAEGYRLNIAHAPGTAIATVHRHGKVLGHVELVDWEPKEEWLDGGPHRVGLREAVIRVLEGHAKGKHEEDGWHGVVAGPKLLSKAEGLPLFKSESGNLPRHEDLYSVPGVEERFGIRNTNSPRQGIPQIALRRMPGSGLEGLYGTPSENGRSQALSHESGTAPGSQGLPGSAQGRNSGLACGQEGRVVSENERAEVGSVSGLPSDLYPIRDGLGPQGALHKAERRGVDGGPSHELGQNPGRSGEVRPGVQQLPSDTNVQSPAGSHVTAAHPTYQRGVDARRAGIGAGRNIWSRDSRAVASNAGRTLTVQFASALLQGNRKRDESDDYYDSLYSKREGYHRMEDTWEVPQWAAHIHHSLPDADHYTVRDPEEAIAFMKQAGYKNVAFSSLDVTAPFIKKLAQSLPNQHFVVGGYTDMNQYAEHPNVAVHPTVQSFVESEGHEYKPGYDYRHFNGVQVIPRLTLSDGCRHNCTFCCVPKQVTEVPMHVVEQQADAFAKDLNAELVYLNDKTFGQAPNHAQLPALYQRIRAKNPNFKGFVVQTTAAQMKRFTPEFIRDAGIRHIELGIESVNDPILRAHKKPANEALIEEAAQKIRAAGSSLIPNIMVGLPGEDKETYGRTMDWLKRNRDIISHVNTYNLALYEESELGKKLQAVNAADRDENQQVKSWMTDPAVHKNFSEKLFQFANEQLDQPVGHVGAGQTIGDQSVLAQPLAKAEGGYSLSHEWMTPGSFWVYAHAPTGERVGHTIVGMDKDPASMRAMGTLVEEPHRRKGVATAMYRYAEKLANRKLRPDDDQTEAGQALWDQPERPFGKAEYENAPADEGPWSYVGTLCNLGGAWGVRSVKKSDDGGEALTIDEIHNKYPKHWFHLSSQPPGPDGTLTLKPGIPEGAMEGEDRKTRRVSVGPSIYHCIAGIVSAPGVRAEEGAEDADEEGDAGYMVSQMPELIDRYAGMHVYVVPHQARRIRYPSERQVPDVNDTGEAWLTKPARAVHLGQIATSHRFESVPQWGRGATRKVWDAPRLVKAEDENAPMAASVLVHNENGQVLWGRRRKDGKWTLPGGHLEPGEDPASAAVRELFEEAGLTPTSIYHFGTSNTPNGIPVFMFYAVVENQQPHAGFDPDNEVAEWRWVDCLMGCPSEIRNNLAHPKNVIVEHLGW